MGQLYQRGRIYWVKNYVNERPGRGGGSSVAQASQAARGADRGVMLRPVKRSTTPSRSIRQTIASTARGRQ